MDAKAKPPEWQNWENDRLNYTYAPVYSLLGLDKLLIAADATSICCISFVNKGEEVSPPSKWLYISNDELMEKSEILWKAVTQLSEYMQGQRRTFDLPFKFKGTEFQKAVWRELEKIPFGQTISYSQLATRVGKPKAARAVGAANGKNPLPICVPCHRVIGANGSLTGFSGGIKVKESLLALERKFARKSKTDASTDCNIEQEKEETTTNPKRQRTEEESNKEKEKGKEKKRKRIENEEEEEQEEESEKNETLEPK